MEAEIRDLKDQLAAQAQEIAVLKARLTAYEAAAGLQPTVAAEDFETLLSPLPAVPELNKVDVAKFSRQMILPEFRARGQLRLKVS